MKKNTAAFVLLSFILTLAFPIGWAAEDQTTQENSETLSVSEDMPALSEDPGDEVRTAPATDELAPAKTEEEAAPASVSGSPEEYQDLEKALKQDRLDNLEQRIEDLKQENQFLAERVTMLERSVRDLKDRTRMT